MPTLNTHSALITGSKSCRVSSRRSSHSGSHKSGFRGDGRRSLHGRGRRVPNDCTDDTHANYTLQVHIDGSDIAVQQIADDEPE
jgi:hypothetical protein